MSNVNTYRVIDFIMPFLPEPVGDSMVLAQRHLNELVAAYNALAPDWANAPDWAQWYVITSMHRGMWSETPLRATLEGWRDDSEIIGLWNLADVVVVPAGIDWRLCKWSREGAK